MTERSGTDSARGPAQGAEGLDGSSGDQGGVFREASGLEETLSEEVVPKALLLMLDMVQGPDRLPADEEWQEWLRGKLRLLQADSSDSPLREFPAHLASISSENKEILVTFKTFEDTWHFMTYHALGFLGHCMESLLLDEKSWLRAVEKDVGIEVSVKEETLQLLYSSILMQEGSFFASCSTDQMFDSSTSGGDLYLEQGDVAQFEPPFLGSGWTVLCLADGRRGTAPKPLLEPIHPFHQWFLKSCAESILVGDGKPACNFPLLFARGTCEAIEEHPAKGPDELSMAPGDRISIVGLLVPCFDWFAGLKEGTGEVGLVRTKLVKPCNDAHVAANILLDEEDGSFFSLREEKVIEETTAFLKRKCENDTSHSYKLDIILDPEVIKSDGSASKADVLSSDLKRNIQRILDQARDVPLQAETRTSVQEHPVDPPEPVNPPRFTVKPVVQENSNPEDFILLLAFLEGKDYKVEFGALYHRNPELLVSTFTGHSDEDDLIAFLGVARETARKKGLFWSQTRLCYLLGKLSARRSKFSQARVYFEEALSLPQESFTDLRLLASIYSNLAAIYLLQKNTESFFAMRDRLVALLMGIPYCLEFLTDSATLKYILKKAILSHNSMAEARACFLLTKHHWIRAETSRAVPYIERLLVLCVEGEGTRYISPSHGYLTLGRLYGEMSLQLLSVSSARRACLHHSASLTEVLSSVALVASSVQRLKGIPEEEECLPAQTAPYLQGSLSFIGTPGGGSNIFYVLKHQVTLCLCQLFYKQCMVGNAVQHLQTLIGDSPSSQLPHISAKEIKSALIWLAWLHLNNNQPAAALEILDSILATMPEHCTSPLEGLILNMRGITLRCTSDLRGAAESYRAALDICQENEDQANCAVAQANLGLLCLRAGAKGLAQRHLHEAVQLFSLLDREGHEESFVKVLLQLGQLYVKQRQLDSGKGCYEWALLLAIHYDLPQCQLEATQHLSLLYSCESPDLVQCMVYRQHQVQLLHHSGDRGQEGATLEALSQLYLSLGTHRAYRAALDFTKSSLGVYIDLGCREKEAYGWLEAGKIYHLLGQTELVDLYLQAAQDVAQSLGDNGFIMALLEAAGDVFFNSSHDRDKAITFYKDRALPIAVRSSSVSAKLRLCNKLTELLLSLKLYGEAVEFGQTVLDICITLGERLNERVACHRLASLYHHLQQFELAEHFYLKALALCPAPLQFDEEALYYARVYQTLGDIIFYDLKDPFDAAGYYHLALAAAMDVGNKHSQLHLCTRLATIYHNFLTDRELSLFFYKRARALAAELNLRRVNISLHQSRLSAS